MQTTRLHLRCSDAELDAWREAAERDGRTLSAWIRQQLNGRRAPATEPSERRHTATALLDHPAIRRASELEPERFRPDPKASQR